MLMLQVKAPFGAFRPFLAGSYRQSAPFITPTAAYGLLLNLAGFESRRVDPELVATDTAHCLPACELAIGVVGQGPFTCRLLQQLHNYPVGSDSKDNAGRTRGAKYNIQPVHREVLCSIDARLALRGHQLLLDRVRQGLREGLSSPQFNGAPRYGVPFLGDNAYMVDHIRELDDDMAWSNPARWYCRRSSFSTDAGVLPGTCRMPVWIDRNDMARTKTDVFALSEPNRTPPLQAWIAIAPPS